MTHVGIVGAGAGAAALSFVVDGALPDADITVLEKSTVVCGRAATRQRGPVTYDYGANYVKSDDDRVVELLTETLATRGLVDASEPIYTFDRTGTVSPGRDADEHKWSYQVGISELAHRLFDRTDVRLVHNTRVETVRRTDDTWALVDTSGTEWGPFDAVVLNPPAPQTAQLLADAEWDSSVREHLHDAVADVPFRSIWTSVLHYPFAIERPYYALVNTDKEHAVGWISREECKAGHVPADESVLIVQASPAWSEEHYDEKPATNDRQLARLAASIMDDERLAEPDWTDNQFWRYALPDAGVDAGPLQSARDAGLYCVGDWVAGEARLHAALRNGLDTGERLAYSL